MIGCRDPEIARSLFDAGFSQGDQTALVGAANDDRLMQVLGSSDLAGLELREGEVLASAIVDGAGLLVCAADAAGLQRLTAALRQATHPSLR